MLSLRPLSRRHLPCWLTGLALLLILSSCISIGSASNQVLPGCQKSPCTTSTAGTIPGDIAGVNHVIDTWNNIHLFQTFAYNISDPLAVAKHYDFVWGAELSQVAAFRSGNPNMSISFYIPFNRDWGIFPDSRTRRNLTYWQAVHPDWILYKCDRVTPVTEGSDLAIALDFANPAFLAWQIQSYAQPASVNGYDAIAADNVILRNYYGACGVYDKGHWVQRYSGQLDDPRWRANVIDWLRRMQQALHHLRHPQALIANFYAGKLSLSDPQVQQVVSYVDGVVDEDGFTDLGRNNLTGDNWLQKVRFMESVQKQHKPYYVIDEFPSVGRAEIQWALASYLMGKEYSAALFISTVQGYGSSLLYKEYNAPIGNPNGPMYQKQNVYFRDYSHGVSIVNPSATKTYTVILDARHLYIDLYGNPIGQSVRIPPHFGMVLLILS